MPADNKTSTRRTNKIGTLFIVSQNDEKLKGVVSFEKCAEQASAKFQSPVF